jgi:mitogen-activated protein kinase 15
MSYDVDQALLKDYKLVRKLGVGSYGIVYEAMDRLTGETVAVKKCFGCFNNTTDALRTYREMIALRELSGHPYFVRLLDILSSTSSDLYVVCDYMPADLSIVIKSGVLLDVHKKFITFQVACALEYMHSRDLIHRDIKPGNILLDADCNVKLCDFGLVRTASVDDSNRLTDYIATRWYRAPEIILGSRSYSHAVDMWAVGVVIGEMYLGRQLLPGTSTLNQLERIIELTGHPTDEDLVELGAMSCLHILQNLPGKIAVRSLIDTIGSKTPSVMLDVMRQLLQFSPKRRATACEILSHGAFAMFNAPSDERISTHTISFPNVGPKPGPTEYRSSLLHQIEDWKSKASDRCKRAIHTSIGS